MQKQRRVKIDDRIAVIAGTRVPKAIKAIQLVGNIGNYKPSPAQAQAVTAAIRGAVEDAERRLTGSNLFVLPT